MDKQIVIPAVPVLTSLSVILLLGATGVLLVRRRATTSRLVVAWAACLYVVAVATETIFPWQVELGAGVTQVPVYEHLNLVPDTLVVHPRHFFFNVLMTVPLGVLLPLVMDIRGVKRVAVAALSFSGAIELIQLTTAVLLGSGRTADVNDLIANTLGAVLGYLVFERVAATRSAA